MQIYSDLIEPNPTGANTSADPTLFQKMSGNGVKAASSVRMYEPLQFWFNKIPALALPLVALQYHDVKITLKLKIFMTDILVT